MTVCLIVIQAKKKLDNTTRKFTQQAAAALANHGVLFTLAFAQLFYFCS